MVDAVGDWRNDRISTLDLFEVVKFFRAEEKLLSVEFNEQESPGGERVTVSTASIVNADRLDPPDEFIIAVENESGAVLSESDPIAGSGAGVPVENLGIQFDIGEQVNLTATLYRVENGSRDTPFQIGAGGQVPGPIGQTTAVSPLAEPVLSDLDIAGQGSDASVVAGQAENVSVNITNAGDQTRSFAIELRVGSGDQPTNTQNTAPLAPDETVTVVFRNVTGGLERGDYDLRVGDSQGVSEVTGTATVQFGNVDRVELTPSGTETIVAGETLNVSATAFDASGNVLETNDSAFGWDAGNGSISGAGVFDETTAATYDVVAALGGVTSSATTVTVNEPANFDVTITGVDSAVTEGETVTVAYEVTNTGDVQATQDIEFAVNGTTEGTEPGVTLNGSESFSGQFTYDTVVGDSPAVSVSVSSNDDAATETVTVDEPANFGVTITSIDSAVTEGETVTVSYEVTNTGDVQATQDIEFAVNGTTEGTETGVTLNRSETFSGQFTYATVVGDSPAVSVTVSSADDTATETVIVTEPAASFDVTITSVDSAVTEGESITVAYEVTNTGGAQDTQDIFFAVNGTTEDIASGVILNGSETFSSQFTYQTVAGDAPAVDVVVSSANDSASETVTVTQPANFDVTITSVDSAVTEGESITVAYEVTNTGGAQDTQDIFFAVNGTTEDIASGVILNGSETFSSQFTYQTVAGDAPAVDVVVSSANDSDSDTVTVNEPANFDVTITSIDSAVTEGETITVAYEVTNTGGAQATQNIEFAVNGTTEGIESGVTLNGSETFSGQFTYTTVVGDSPAVSVSVSSADDAAAETVTVDEPATPALSALEVAGQGETVTILEGDNESIAADVTNVGDRAGTFTLDLTVTNGTQQTDSQGTGELAPGETRTVVFENVTGSLVSDTYDVVVETGGKSLTGNLTVDAIESTVEFDATPGAASRGDNLSNDVAVNVSLQRVGPSVAEPVTVGLVFEGLTRAGESETVLGTETVQVERGNTTRVVFDSLAEIPPSAIATDGEPVTLRAETGDDTATREVDVSNPVADAAAEAVGGSEVVTVLGAIDVGGESVELGSGLEGLTLDGFDASARLFSGNTTLPGPGTSGLLELRADNVTVRNLDLGLGGSVTGGLPVIDIAANDTTVDNVTATRNATGTDDQFTQVVRIGENTTGSTVTASTLGGQGVALNAIVTDDAGNATVTDNVFEGDVDVGVTLAGNGSAVEANNFSAVGEAVDAYVFDFDQAADLSAIGGANSFGPAASLTSVDFQTGGVRVNGSSLVPGPGPARSFNTTQVEPGGTVEVTVTATLDSVADVSFADKWSPDFSSAELVDTSFSTALESVTGGDAIVRGDNVAAGELTIVYRVSVSDSAAVGTTYEWTEFPDSAIRIGNTDFGIIGDDTVEVVSNSG